MPGRDRGGGRGRAAAAGHRAPLSPRPRQALLFRLRPRRSRRGARNQFGLALGPGHTALELALSRGQRAAAGRADQAVVSSQQPATTSRSQALRVDRKDWGAIDDVIDQAVIASLFGTHETVAVGVFLQPLERLARVPLVDLVELFLHADELLRVDQD